MALQNRVDPFGAIFATPHRGHWMGNRGRLHNDGQRLVRKWATKTWVTCALAFNGRQRTIMSAHSYTELFFLDEATALAAGHRPCAECRRKDYLRYKQAFADGQAGRGTPIAKAADMDRVLHAQRTSPRPCGAAAALPDGAFVALDDVAWLKQGDELLRWSAAGYDESRRLPSQPVLVLTPAASLSAVAAGYRPQLHASAIIA